MSENENAPGEIRKLQLEELKILLELDRVCKQIGVRYFLFSGTLLGAVRHKGFIPWDDDVDVAMVRNDYSKFIEEAPKVLNSNYFLQTVESDPDYPYVFAKVRNSTTTFIENNLSDLDINHGIYIDIFPLDGAPTGRLAQKIWWRIISLMDNIVLIKSSRIDKSRKGYGCLKFLGKVMPISSKNLIHFQQSICRIRKPETSKFLLFTTDPSVKLNVVLYDKEWLKDVAYIPFEGHEFPVPIGYDKVLTAMFKDYMVLPPVEKRVSPHRGVEISIDIPYKYYIYKNK